MYKILIKFILIFLFLTKITYSEIIKKVEVKGNQRISKETIQVLGKIKIGENFTNNSLNESLKELYETDFFSQIKIDLDEGILKINVVENPIIEKININGIKKKSFTEILYSSISLKDRMSFTDYKFQNDIITIKNILKTNGYYFSEINVSTDTNSDLNSIVLNLDINLGKKAKIKNIVFIGDKKFKDKKLLELIASEEHKFWKFITNKVYLNKSLIDLDKRLLNNFYKNNGYYNVKILNSFAELSDDGYFKLTFNIDAGKKYFFNNLTLNLPDDYNTKDFSEITKIFTSLKNEQY